MPHQSTIIHYDKFVKCLEKLSKTEDIWIDSENEVLVENASEPIDHDYCAPENFDVTSEAAPKEFRTSEANPILSDDFTSTEDSEDLRHMTSEGTVKRNPSKAHPERIEQSPKRVKFEFENINFEHPPSSVLQNWSMILNWELDRIDSNYFKNLTQKWKTLMVKIGTWGSPENLSFHEISEDFKTTFKKLKAVASSGESETTDAQEFIEQLLQNFKVCSNVSKKQEREELWKEIIRIMEEKLEEIMEGQVFTFKTINDCFRDMARDIDVIC